MGFGAQGLGHFTVLAILARYLTAEEFGVMTATLIVVGFGNALTFDTIGPALVQRDNLREAHVRSGFALAVLTATVMVVGLWFLAPATERFFAMESLAGVMRALSLVFVFQAPGVVPHALLQRDLNLRSLAIAEATSTLLGFIPAGVGLAVLGFGIWSLVAAYVCQALLKSVVLVFQRSHRRSLLLDLAATRSCCSSAAASWSRGSSITALHRGTISSSASGCRTRPSASTAEPTS